MKNKTLILVLVVVLILIVGGILLFTNKGVKEEVPILPEETTPTVLEEPTTETVAEEKTPIEIAFETAKDVEIKSQKAKDEDAVLRPVLKSVFDTVDENGETVSGVKMTEEFGPMLSYVFNRKLTETERDAIIKGLEEVGVKAVDTTEKVVTVKKGSSMWVITFYLNNDSKSSLTVTF